MYKRQLVRWLVNAFSGENPHYEADSEWHGNGGLADYLAETLDYHGHSPRQVITHEMCIRDRTIESTWWNLSQCV